MINPKKVILSSFLFYKIICRTRINPVPYYHYHSNTHFWLVLCLLLINAIIWHFAWIFLYVYLSTTNASTIGLVRSIRLCPKLIKRPNSFLVLIFVISLYFFFLPVFALASAIKVMMRGASFNWIIWYKS